jgi:hypothetical protein
MTRMTERLPDRPSMILPISHSLHGTKYPRKARTFAKVSLSYLITLIELLEKNRHKRPSLEEVLNHQALRAKNNENSKFQAYTLLEPNSPKIKEELLKYQ